MIFKDWNGQERELPKGTPFTWRPSVYALIVKEGMLLCVQSKLHGKWEIPGGAMELGETPLQSLLREVHEETGYTINLLSEIPIVLKNNFFYAPGPEKYWQALCMVFPAQLKDPTQIASVNDSQEISQVRWIPLSELHSHEFHHLVGEVLHEVLSAKSLTV